MFSFLQLKSAKTTLMAYPHIHTHKKYILNLNLMPEDVNVLLRESYIFKISE